MSKVEERIKLERETLKKKVYSFTALVDLMAIYINEPEFEGHIMKMEDEDTVAEIKTYPVKKFRKTLKNILQDFGVAEKDAAKIVDEYKFKKKDVETIYEFVTEFQYQYLQTGRRLELFDKRDMNVSIIAEDVKGGIKHKEANERIPETTTKYDDHKKVSSKSTCPKWKKQKLDNKDNSKVLKAIKSIYKEEE